MTHDDEKMLRAHTGTKPETPIDGESEYWGRLRIQHHCGGGRSHGAWGLHTVDVRHSLRYPTCSRTSTERREDVQSKWRDVEIRGALKPARAITHGEASPAGLSQCADLENELQTSNGARSSKDGEERRRFRNDMACAEHETLQPKPLNRRVPERENGTVDRNSASVGRWGVFMW